MYSSKWPSTVRMNGILTGPLFQSRPSAYAMVASELNDMTAPSTQRIRLSYTDHEISPKVSYEFFFCCAAESELLSGGSGPYAAKPTTASGPKTLTQ